MEGVRIEAGQAQQNGPSLDQRRQVFHQLHQALAGAPQEPKPSDVAVPSEPSRELAYLYFVAESDATVAKPGPEGFRRVEEDLYALASADFLLWELLVRDQIRETLGGTVRLRSMALGQGSLTIFLVVGFTALKTVKDYPAIREGIQELTKDLRRLFSRILSSKAAGRIRVVARWEPGPAMKEEQAKPEPAKAKNAPAAARKASKRA